MILSLLSVTILICGLLIGLIPALVDSIQKQLQDRLKLPEGRVDWFVRIFYAAWLPAMPLAGWVIDTWQIHKSVLFFGLIGLILGLAWLALARTFATLMLSGFFLGLAYSCATTTAISLMATVFFPLDETARHKLTIAGINLGFITVGLGAAIAPWIAWAIERWCGIRQGLLYVSVALILPAALAALCESNGLVPIHPVVDSWAEVVAHPSMGLLVVILLLYFAIENCLEFWPEAYLRDLGFQDTGRQASLLVFWLAFIGMRGLTAWLLYEYAHYPHFAFILTIIFVIASALVLGNLSGGLDLGSGTVGLWLVGACYGPLLPAFIGMAFDVYSKPLPISILGVLLALSAVDTLVMRPIMNAFGKDRPARMVMRVPAVLALVLSAPLVFLALLRTL